MAVRVRRIAFGAALLLLIGIGVWTFAQGKPAIAPQTVFSGSDVGVRIDGARGSIPTGTLVVRVEGKWIEVELSSKARVVPAR